MRQSKYLALVGVTACFMTSNMGAEAKTIYYEINGQRFSYSSNNRQQVEEARKRIEAANAAQTAKAKAQAEARSNPLGQLFGSPAQREATTAEARLNALMRSAPKETTPLADDSPRRVEPRNASTRRSNRAAEDEPRPQPAPATTGTTAIRKQDRPRPSEDPSPQVAVAEPAAGFGSPGVRSVTFDLETGIRTLHMLDGSVHEEPFDPKMLAKLGSGAPAATSSLHESSRRAAAGAR
jgi:hypothetical protein